MPLDARRAESGAVGDDDIPFQAVLHDLLEMGARRSAPGGLARAKRIEEWAALAGEMRGLLASLGIEGARLNRSLLVTFPALIGAMVRGDRAGEVPPAAEWAAAMRKTSDRYISASEPFSLNLMNVGLNLAQLNLFRAHDLPGNVLELGSGGGYVSDLFLADARRRTVLSDLLPSTLVEAGRYGFAGRVGIDMHHLPYADDSFDTLVSIHSVDNAGAREATLREALRVLRPGGSFLFTDYLTGFLSARPLPRVLSAIGLSDLGGEYASYALRYSIDDEDRVSFTLPEYLRLLTGIGFEVAESRTFFGSRLFSY